jgi:hypothetical protein
MDPKQVTQDVGFGVTASDVHAFMEVCHDVDERELDLIVHSPGGSVEAAEQIVDYLRSQFDDVRVFVPLQAKSAATMIALGADEIWMGLHSELGLIDPQLLLQVGEIRRWAPAHAVLRDFRRARDELQQDVNHLPVWTPILRSYAGGLIDICTQTIELSQDVVAKWLAAYMLKDQADETARNSRAREIAEYFGGEEAYERFRTHGRPIRIEELEGIDGLKVRRLEDDDALQDAVLSVYHTLDLTFIHSPAVKIVENHRRARYVRLLEQRVIQVPGPPPGATPTSPKRPQPVPFKPALSTPKKAPRPRQQHRKKRKK